MNAKLSQKNTEDLTAHILNIAAIHFSEKGFSGARVDEIAKEAGVNKSSMYYRVGDKKALYHSVIFNMITQMVDTAATRINHANSPEDKLKAYIHTLADLILGQPHFAPLMLREIASGGTNMSTDTLKAMNQMKGFAKAILEEGHEAGIFRESNYALVHIIIVSTFNLIAAGTPIRERLSALTDTETCLCENPELPYEKLVNDMTDFVFCALKTNK